MTYPIKGYFKSFGNYIKITGHGEKESDPKQITNIKSAEKVVYLTFDTCPTDKVDYKIINFLEDNEIEATIFLNVEWYKNNTDKNLNFLKNPLFSLGGHGYHHKRPMRLSFDEQLLDIRECIDFIKNELGIKIGLYRSPYGRPNEDTINILDDFGIKFISWSGSVMDRKVKSLHYNLEQRLETQLNYGTKSGDILVFHINLEEENSFQLFKRAYDILKSKGFSFKKIK